MLNSLLAALMVIAPQPTPVPADVELRQNIAQYQELAEDLAATVSQTEVLRRQITGLKQQMGQRRSAVGRLASASYRTYRADSLNVLLDAKSTGDFRDRLMVLDVFAQYRRLEIRELSITVDRYVVAQRTLDSLIVQQRSQQQELIAQRQRIDARLASLRGSPPSPR